MSLQNIPELYKVEQSGNEIKFGARVTQTEFRHYIKDKLPEFATYLDIFASPQIKKISTIVGNVANASPIGDTPPALLALDAVIVTNKREIPISKFFLAYRKTALEMGELITHIKFNLPSKDASVRFFKYSSRKDLDISAVNFAIHVDWKDKAKKEIRDVRIAAGGVSAIPLRLLKTEEFLKKNFDVEGAVKELHQEFNPLSDLRASAAYRHILIENYFRKFCAEVQ